MNTYKVSYVEAGQPKSEVILAEAETQASDYTLTRHKDVNIQAVTLRDKDIVSIPGAPVPAVVEPPAKPIEESEHEST